MSDEHLTDLDLIDRFEGLCDEQRMMTHLAHTTKCEECAQELVLLKGELLPLSAAAQKATIQNYRSLLGQHLRALDIEQFYEGLCPQEDQTRIAAHLQLCTVCSSRYRELQETLDDFQPSPPTPEDIEMALKIVAQYESAKRTADEVLGKARKDS